MKHAARSSSWSAPWSAFAGFRFPVDVIVVAVRWYLRYGLFYRDVEELLAERGIEVDHVTVYRWAQRFTPLLATPPASRDMHRATGGSSTKTYVKVNGVWRYVHRAIKPSSTHAISPCLAKCIGGAGVVRPASPSPR
jgi:transposase-like protein